MKNINLSDNNSILYNLICFIEVITNIVYFKDNNNVWYKYLGNNNYVKIDNLGNIRPILLFYKLTYNS